MPALRARPKFLLVLSEETVMVKQHWNANLATQCAGSDYLDDYPPARDGGESLGDILRDAMAIRTKCNHAHYYETLTSQYEAAGFLAAVR